MCFSSPTTITSLSMLLSLSSLLNMMGTVLMMAIRNNNVSLDVWFYFEQRQLDTMLSILHTHRCCCNVILSSILSALSLSNNNTGMNCQNTGISHSKNSDNCRIEFQDWIVRITQKQLIRICCFFFSVLCCVDFFCVFFYGFYKSISYLTIPRILYDFLSGSSW